MVRAVFIVIRQLVWAYHHTDTHSHSILPILSLLCRHRLFDGLHNLLCPLSQRKFFDVREQLHTLPSTRLVIFLSDFVSKLEVVPHHVSLANDWNLVAATVRTDESADKQLSVDCLRQLYMQLMTPLSCRSFQKLNGFKNQPLQLCQPYGNPLEIRPTIPHSILLIGSTTLELNLSMTTLRRLPHHFGLYFPCLAVLRLYDNHLEELPETMHHLKHLEELDVGKNYLAQLPTQFALPKLTQLKARENRLTQLPATVKDCKNLELLDLSGNPVGKEIWSLVAALPRLREVLPKSA